MYQTLPEAVSARLKLFGSHFRQSFVPMSQNAWTWVQSRAPRWQYGTVIVGAGLFFAWIWWGHPPAECDPKNSPEHCDLSVAWRHSIEKLGIRPLYPPREDINVGDVYFVLVAPDPKYRRAEPYRYDGRSLRVHRYEMWSEIDDFYRKAVVFPGKSHSSAHLRNGVDQALLDTIFIPNGGRRDLPIVAFPTLEIEYATSRGAVMRIPVINARLSWAGNSKEIIRIPEAESYSVLAPKAIEKLQEFCKGDDCKEEFARYVLSAAFGRDIAEETDRCGQYVYDIEIQLINQVTLTRTIFHERSAGSRSDGRMRVALEIQDALNNVRAQLAAATKHGAFQQDNDDRVAAQLATEKAVLTAQKEALEAERVRLEQLFRSVSDAGAETAAIARQDSNNRVMLQHTFDRPVAIGFERVSFPARVDSERKRKKCR